MKGLAYLQLFPILWARWKNAILCHLSEDICLSVRSSVTPYCSHFLLLFFPLFFLFSVQLPPFLFVPHLFCLFYNTAIRYCAAALFEGFGMEDELKGRQHIKKTTSQQDNLTARQPHSKTTSQQENLTARQPHRKTTSQEDNLTGIRPHKKTRLKEDVLTERQPLRNS